MDIHCLFDMREGCFCSGFSGGSKGTTALTVLEFRVHLKPFDPHLRNESLESKGRDAEPWWLSGWGVSLAAGVQELKQTIQG